MRTVRRFYFYLIALISLEVVMWGVVNLIRNIFNLMPGESAVGVVSTGLAQVLVGAPIFLLHWRAAQRDAARDDDERSSQIRAAFLYGTLTALFIPIVYSAWAIANRAALRVMGLIVQRAWVGGSQSDLDNLIAILVVSVVFYYIYRIAQSDWRVNPGGRELADWRRRHRYAWFLFGLVTLVIGVRAVLTFLFHQADPLLASEYDLANGLVAIVIGLAVLAWFWRLIERSLDRPEEKYASLRMVILFLITLVSAVTVLSSSAVILDRILKILMGESTTWVTLLDQLSGIVATIIPFIVLWAYFGGRFWQELAALPDKGQQRSINRLYQSILAFLGNVTSFGGLVGLLYFLVRYFILALSTFATLRWMLSASLSALLIGLPFWLFPWLQMQREAARLDEIGDHARRSVVRKAYLYLVIFLLVVGGMGSAGTLLYLLITRALGGLVNDFARQTLEWLVTFILVAVWLAYHLRQLAQDGKLAQRWLSERHEKFPVLILQADNERFTMELVQALQRSMPRLPISVHRAEQGAPGEHLLSARAVILPGNLALDANEALRAWLSEYQGSKIVIPFPTPGWVYLHAGQPDERELANQTAQATRQLAEGQPVRPGQAASSWAVAGYIAAGFLGLILLTAFLSALFDGF